MGEEVDLPARKDHLLAVVLRDERVALIRGDAAVRPQLHHLLGQVVRAFVGERVRVDVVQAGREQHRLALRRLAARRVWARRSWARALALHQRARLHSSLPHSLHLPPRLRLPPRPSENG